MRNFLDLIFLDNLESALCWTTLHFNLLNTLMFSGDGTYTYPNKLELIFSLENAEYLFTYLIHV